jgi:hypothetical protein
MNKTKWTRMAVLLSLVGILIMVGCRSAADSQPDSTETTPDQPQAEQGGATANDMADWLRQIQDGSIDSYNVAAADDAEQSFRWGLGYLTYYGTMSQIGLDNMIYNALRAHIRLATGETTADNLPRDDSNLLQITDGIQRDPNTQPENQIGQTPAIRQAILDRVVADQRTLSPDDALASGEIIGVIAIPSPEDIGAKYLVYGQAMPGDDFVFLGVALVVDAIARESASMGAYTYGSWDHLPWLGDAAGPFWEQVPAGGSGDPARTTEGRPGVLFVHEGQYQAVK